ncbi:hypothetical protein D1AOALGA4SA_8982 [Olavius algarvensis Delta 1 endosymbiont]|nr:hypothetical protein D1AOALGA4SA_8982 [Olavius algarvensis Delta 1 endosymbiont]
MSLLWSLCVFLFLFPVSSGPDSFPSWQGHYVKPLFSRRLLHWRGNSLGNLDFLRATRVGGFALLLDSETVLEIKGSGLFVWPIVHTITQATPAFLQYLH